MRDVKTQLPIKGAHIFYVGTDRVAISDSLGYFELCNVNSLGGILQFSHIAYETEEVKIFSQKPEVLRVFLKVKSFEFDEVLVSGNLSSASMLPGLQKIDQSQILSMPTLMGENDVVRTLQQLSGVQTVSEGVGGVFVRGGGAGHNLLMLDNMELMNPVHLMGIYSVFNPLTTAKVELYKGNSPVYMRGKIASSIIVSSINPFLVQNNYQGSIGNLSSNLALTQKSKNNKLAINLGLRRSYLDVIKGITSLFVSSDQNYFNRYFYSFYDFNGLITYRPNSKSSLSFGWYLGEDDFLISDEAVGYDATNNYGNKSMVVDFKSLIANNISLSASVNGTKTWSRFEGDMLGNQVYFSSELEQIAAKLSLVYEKPRHLIRFGMDVFCYQTTPQDLQISINEDTVRRRDEFFNADFSLFIEDSYTVNEHFKVYAGVRGYKYWNYGPRPTGGSLWKKPPKSISSYVPLVPSISFSYIPNSLVNYKLAYSYNVQMGHLASVSSIPLPNDIWMMSSDVLKPERAHQLSFSYNRNLSFGSVVFELYGKSLRNQLIFNVNMDKNEEMVFEDHFFKGKGRAYGAEISIDKTKGKLTGMLNYTLSRSKRSFPKIYQGKWFNDKFDRIHDLSLVANYNLGKRWEIGGNWVFASGNNLTLPSGRYWAMGTIMSDYDGFNTFRMPPYHRLDLSANYKLKSKLFKESVINFSVINVYNRSNPYFIFYKVYQGSSQYDIDIKGSQVSLFPIMPSINWRFKI